MVMLALAFLLLLSGTLLLGAWAATYLPWVRRLIDPYDDASSWQPTWTERR